VSVYFLGPRAVDNKHPAARTPDDLQPLIIETVNVTVTYLTALSIL